MAEYQSEFQGATIDARLAAVATMQTAISNLETAVAAKYSKPSSGIPETDLDASVQAALALARTAVQSLSDYYTKAQVDDITAAIVASVNSTSGEVVTTLPSAGAGTLGKMYYVGPDANGFYDRYVTSYDGSTYSWLPLGNTEVDMAQYATKAEFDKKTAKIENESSATVPEDEEEILVTDDSETEIIARLNRSGLTANAFFAKNAGGDYVKVLTEEYPVIPFDGIFLANPTNYGRATFSLYFKVPEGVFYQNVSGVPTATPALTNVVYEDPNGRKFIYRDTLRPLSPLSHYTHIEDNDMPDLTTVVSSFTITNGKNVPSNVYALFDSLIGSGISSKMDAPALVDMEYPAYANGIDASDDTYYVNDGDSHETPAYKIYMYKIPRFAASQPSGRKMFLFSGEHGNERVGIYDLYVFAYNLINSTKPFYTYIRANFDVYILPMLSVYSVYHNLRVNADGVNLNRNYPMDGWVEQGAGTDNYTGPSAGSEFETQLVMALMQYIKPHVTLDHHNYSTLDRQFYCSAFDADVTAAMGKSVVGVSDAFVKNYPAYFGNTAKIFAASMSNYSYGGGSLVGQFALWADLNGYPATLLAEVGECVNYLAGENSPDYNREHYTHVVFELAEYTLRSMLGNIVEIFTKSMFTRLTY